MGANNTSAGQWAEAAVLDQVVVQEIRHSRKMTPFVMIELFYLD
jgi:hypothetical protein